MKTGHQRTTRQTESRSGMKRDRKRGRMLRKTLDEMKRQTGQEVRFIEGLCFDYCC